MRPPLFLSRRPDEPPDLDLAGWYRRLLAAVPGHHVRAGTWRLLPASGWRGNQSCANLAAWSWAGEHGGNRHLVVVNLSGQPVQARVPLDWPDLSGRSWRLTDILRQSVFERDGAELASPGLFVDLGPWQFHLLAVQLSAAAAGALLATGRLHGRRKAPVPAGGGPPDKLAKKDGWARRVYPFLGSRSMRWHREAHAASALHRCSRRATWASAPCSRAQPGGSPGVGNVGP